VPWDWQNYDFSQCIVNSGENVPWEYTENEVCEDAMYPSTAHLKDAVKQWSTLTLYMVKSSPRIYLVCWIVLFFINLCRFVVLFFDSD
jgi:hypothetical protein